LTTPSGSAAVRGPRFVGSVVDPDYGHDDPWGTGSLESPDSGPSGSGTPASSVAGFDSGESDAARFVDRPHPVRQRLLARASSENPSAGSEPRLGSRRGTAHSNSPPPERLGSRRDPAPESAPPSSRGIHLQSGLEELARDEPGAPRTELDSELDRIALGPMGGPDGSGSRPSSLSPNLIAVFGALLGLTTVGSLVALASRLDSGPKVALSASAATAVVSAAQTAAPAPEARQKIPAPWRIADERGKPEARIITGRIGKNAFLKAIQDAGVDKSQAYRAYNALKSTVDLNRCKASDEFIALIERGSGKLRAFEYVVSKEEVFQAAPGPDGALVGQKLDLKVGRNQVRRGLVFDGQSFDASAKAAGFDDGLGEVLGKALSGHMALSELERGDRLRVVAQEITVLGEFSRYAGIEAIEVLRHDEKPLRIYFYGHATDGGYFDNDGRAPYEGGWRKPIPGAPITSKFNPKRLHPVLKKVMPHTGTDFGAPTGTPIGASAPGVISFIGNGGPSGNLVKVMHAGGIETGYAHMSRFGEGLKTGDKVKRLQLLGYVGSTGRSTGPHLHFTAKKNGEFFDAETLNMDGMRVLPPSQRASFAEVKGKYDALLDAIVLPAELPPAPVAAPAVADGPAAPTSINEEGDGDPALSEPDVDAGAKPAAAPQPAAPAPGPAPPAGAPAKPKSGSSVFLSDEELLKAQGTSDDGEVSD
jgi:murein DD-endopeptidase MepM/ murein hydrolase activator NlpD